MKRKIEIDPSDVFVTGANLAGIRDKVLVNYLLKDTADAVEDLSSTFVPVTADQISIDETGAVIIDSAEFLTFAKDTVNNPITPVAGWGCANGACL